MYFYKAHIICSITKEGKTQHIHINISSKWLHNVTKIVTDENTNTSAHTHIFTTPSKPIILSDDEDTGGGGKYSAPIATGHIIFIRK